MSVLGQEQTGAASHQVAQIHSGQSTPLNTVVMFVPQQEAWVVERMGKFHRILEPGITVLIPILDRVKYVQNLKETAVDIPQQSAITIGKQYLIYFMKACFCSNILDVLNAYFHLQIFFLFGNCEK
jgi:hypothetical protein